MKNLPIGVQTFEKIIKQDCIYIDKTYMALDIINNYNYVFLSRPRRFGKSLFLDTLKNIFEAKKELFKGLYIYDKWNWDESYPVIKIDWAGDFKTLESTKKVAFEVLKENQERLGITCSNDSTPSGCFRELIRKASQKYNKRVVVLIDEYDKPILDNLENPKTALENRDFLRSFYVMLKANDEYIKFAFLTGISKFSKANIFSGLNNIIDISLKPEYSTICGYTQDDIEKDFKEYLKGANLELVKEWYNGYNFLGKNIYNPFDILQFIDNDFLFKNYWWESGNPSFLIKMLKKRPYNIPELENIVVGDEILNSFEIENLRLEVLLFQSGYLTIKEFINDPEFGINEYKLKVPNKEVRISLNRLFLDYLTNSARVDISFIRAMQNANIEKFKETFISLFASIPYNNYVKNSIAEYEGYYASVFYAYLVASGLNITAEDVTNAGRIDLTINLKDKIYIVEFKVTEKGSKGEKEQRGNGIIKENSALKQLKEKNYAQKYQSLITNHQSTIYLIGIEFCKEEKNICSFEWEKVG